ncbi:hypothetical protein evm_003032 [Chilo suppressalis]|nr:hypothetical protein evm_003032 [Chilo suppressalis]
MSRIFQTTQHHLCSVCPIRSPTLMCQVSCVYTQSQSVPLSPQLQAHSSSSYRKTVLLPTRNRAPVPKSFDRLAHQAIVSDVPPSLPNGPNLENPYSTSSDDRFLEHIISLLTDILCRFNDMLFVLFADFDIDISINMTLTDCLTDNDINERLRNQKESNKKKINLS